MAHDSARRLTERLRQLREALGLSQEAFAERAGLKYKHYQAIEAGRKTDVRFSTLDKLARACGMEIWELLNVDVSPLALAEEPGKEKFRAPRRRKTTRRSGGKT